MDKDILIAGGGLNGLTLALALAQAGQRVTVIDALAQSVRADAGFDGRSYALALTSQRLLGGLGLWTGLAAQAQPILDIKVCDGHPGQGPGPMVLHFDHAEIEEGPMGYMVEDRYLRRALLQAVEAHQGITHLCDVQVTEHRPTRAGMHVTLDNGTALLGRMLVAADGRRSATARRAGIRHTGWTYGQTALVCAISHAEPHHGMAHQMFMPSGPLAILPLPGNRSSIVWTEQADHAARINAMAAEDYLAVLRPRFGDFLGEIALAGDRFTYPLSLSLADRFVSDRLALIGDAAHGVHPLAGQGLNAGLRDVAALAETVIDAVRRGEDPGAGAVLTRYQQWRRFDATTLAVATDTFNRLFSNSNPLLRAARDLGLGLAGAMPGVRRSLIREAAGLTGDVPRLMQGKAL